MSTRSLRGDKRRNLKHTSAVVEVRAAPSHRTSPAPKGVLKKGTPPAPVRASTMSPTPAAAARSFLDQCCTGRCTVTVTIAVVAVVGIVLIAVDTSPNGTGSRTPGIICLSVAAAFGLLYFVYLGMHGLRQRSALARSDYVVATSVCELCKASLDAQCPQSHEWLKKRRLEAMSTKARERFERKGETPEFLRSLCPIATGKCGQWRAPVLGGVHGQV